jgi:multiple sugar transport system permease protein
MNLSIGNKRIRIRTSFGRTVAWMLGIIAFILALFPIWWMFNIVFSPAGIPIALNPRFYPTSLVDGLENIRLILRESVFFRAYGNSLMYCFVSIIGTLILCSMAAYEFALFEFPGKNTLFAVVLISLMVPLAVTLIPTYLLIARLGWLNSIRGLAVPGLASAFGLFMLTQFFKDIPKEIMDAAQIDGASHFGGYWYIVMPLSRNALITLAILTFMTTWGNFIWPMVVAKNAQSITVSQLINWYNDPNSFATVNSQMTAFLIAAIIPIIVFIIFQRQIIQGISITGLKG